MGMSQVLHKAKPYLFMVLLQCGTAVMYLTSSVILKRGLIRYVLIVYRKAIAPLVIGPFALVLERKIRPKLTLSVFFQIVALAVLQPVLDQNFSYLGMDLTSAAYTYAIVNAVQAVTFVLAVILGKKTIQMLERLKMKEIRSQAKVIGTLVTFGGALIMIMYKGPIVNLLSPKTSHFPSGDDDSSSVGQHWLSGTLFIIIGCVAWSAFFILQSITIKKYPAGLSLAFLKCLMGSILSAAVTLVAEAHYPDVWNIGFTTKLIAPAYAGVVSSGIAYYVPGIVLKTRGPVFVTAFSPLCMIVTAILGSIILAEKLHLGSIIGAIVIAVGLYAVVWGKGKDDQMSSPTVSGDLAHELPMYKMDGINLKVIGKNTVTVKN